MNLILFEFSLFFPIFHFACKGIEAQTQSQARSNASIHIPPLFQKENDNYNQIKIPTEQLQDGIQSQQDTDMDSETERREEGFIIIYSLPIYYKVFIDFGSKTKTAFFDGGSAKIRMTDKKRKLLYVTKSFTDLFIDISQHVRYREMELYISHNGKYFKIKNHKHLHLSVAHELSKKFPIDGKLTVRLWCKIIASESESTDEWLNK